MRDPLALTGRRLDDRYVPDALVDERAEVHRVEAAPRRFSWVLGVVLVAAMVVVGWLLAAWLR